MQNRHPRRQQGLALPMVLFLLVALALLSAAVLTATAESSRFTRRSSWDAVDQQAAQAGLQAFQSLLAQGQAPVPTVSLSATYLTWRGSSPWVSGDAHFDPDASGFNASTPKAVSLPSALQNVFSQDFPQFQWVRLNWESSGTSPYCYSLGAGKVLSTTADCAGLGSPLFQITAMASTGGVRRVVTAEAVLPPIDLNFNAPAALTLVGDNPTYQDPHSNNWTISGYDQSNPDAPPVAALGTSSSAGVSNLLTQPFRPDATHYPGGNVIPPNPSIVDVVQSGAMPASLATVSGLRQLVQHISSVANIRCGSGTDCPSSAGTGTGFLDPDAPAVTVINGDYTLPGDGGGILLVTGTLTVPNNFNWHGLLLVIGKGVVQFASNGGGHPNTAGAIFVANPCANLSSGLSSQPLPDLSNCSSMGSAQFTTFNGGGNGGFYYNSAIIQQYLQAAASAGGSNSVTGNWKVLGYREE
jgi:Tfp pilus assembly protein PilX